jgi:hypothetical protein
MDIVGIATLLITIPPAMVAMYELGWVKRRSPSDSSTEPPTVAADDGAERVVLTLTPENVRKPGTIQHHLASFETRLPTRYRNENDPNNGLIRNPYYIRWSASGTWRIALIGIVIQAIFTVILFNTSYVSEGNIRIFIEVIGMGSIIFFCVMAVQAMKALAVVDDYLRFLKTNKITIGVELSLPRRVYDARRDLSVGANPE